MKSIYDIKEYVEEIESFSKSVDLSFLDGKTVLIAGASGLVMSYLIDTILSNPKQKTHIIANVYSENDFNRFPRVDNRLSFVVGDVTKPETFKDISKRIDYVINGASIVDPKGYKERPIDTMVINFYGTKNLLDVASKNNATFLLTSSCEIYGQSDDELIKENYFGKINTTDVRSCYNESKRACETLCVCYSQEKGIKTLIARLSRTFGPTQSIYDTKALSQFMKNAILNEDIVLKSEGNQLFSYTYVQDIVRGLLVILQKGESMNAYNVCNREALKLKEVAEICASYNNKKVIFDLTDDGYKTSGYSKASFARQDPSKLESLGYQSHIALKNGIFNTITILKKLYF